MFSDLLVCASALEAGHYAVYDNAYEDGYTGTSIQYRVRCFDTSTTPHTVVWTHLHSPIYFNPQPPYPGYPNGWTHYVLNEEWDTAEVGTYKFYRQKRLTSDPPNTWKQPMLLNVVYVP